MGLVGSINESTARRPPPVSALSVLTKHSVSVEEFCPLGQIDKDWPVRHSRFNDAVSVSGTNFPV